MTGPDMFKAILGRAMLHVGYMRAARETSAVRDCFILRFVVFPYVLRFLPISRHGLQRVSACGWPLRCCGYKSVVSPKDCITHMSNGTLYTQLSSRMTFCT